MLTSEKAGFALLGIGFVLGWIGIDLNWELVDDVRRLAPSKATGLRNFYETWDNNRVWREHKRLFPKSHVRTRSQAFLTLSAVMWFAGFVALFFLGRWM